MALQLYIPPCIHRPPHHLHLPSANKPLRIQIQGPLQSIQKLIPNVPWHPIMSFPQPRGQELTKLIYETLYGAPVVRDEYLAWVMDGRRALDYIDYYGVTFDYLVSPND
ncbi:arginine deiminase type-3 [Colletotrichum tofieldiae]|uniref:Arginine deiminase type-3 n=1 Tax=Colletotrichum tofieldiae TaxID=708197 RepID=A0A161YF08_9PEZI|nr:arginine deiminase type-3 [Colletotrichum tofieldiae]